MPEHLIEDLDSFREATAGPRRLAGLYWYLAIDPLFSLAHAVALDFFRRPQLYTTFDVGGGAGPTGAPATGTAELEAAGSAAAPDRTGSRAFLGHVRRRDESEVREKDLGSSPGSDETAGGAGSAADVEGASLPAAAPVGVVDRGGDGRRPSLQLALLRYASGSHPQVPSEAQRDEVYSAVFGQTARALGAGSGDFQSRYDQLVGAATAFAERVYDTGVEMLRQNVRTQHRLLRSYLASVDGASVGFSVDVSLAGIGEDLAFPLMRNTNVAAIFGVVQPPMADWPYRADPNADKLVEQIAKQLAWDGTGQALTRERFSNLHAVATSGAEAIANVLDLDPGAGTGPGVASDEEIDALITTKVYSWGANLRALRSAP